MSTKHNFSAAASGGVKQDHAAASVKCPKCGAPSKCVDWKETDIGAGLEKLLDVDPEYSCPWHGVWAYTGNGTYSFQDDRTGATHFTKEWWDRYNGFTKGKRP